MCLRTYGDDYMLTKNYNEATKYDTIGTAMQVATKFNEDIGIYIATVLSI